MAAGADAFERIQGAARKLSDGHWELARLLVEVTETGAWRERYVTFDQFVTVECSLFPGMARELMRVQKKVEKLEIDPETAREIGWIKVRTVASKLQPENCDSIVKELETENVQAIRQKHCPRKVPGVARKTTCGPREPQCFDRVEPAVCETDSVATPAPIEQEAVPAVAGSAPIEPAASEQPALSQPVQAQSVEHLLGGKRIEKEIWTKKPGKLEWFDSHGRTRSVGPSVDVSDSVEEAIHVARRYWGPHDDQSCVDGICATFVWLLGLDPEKEVVAARDRAERDKLRYIGWRTTSFPKVLRLAGELAEKMRVAVDSERPEPKHALPTGMPEDDNCRTSRV